MLSGPTIRVPQLKYLLAKKSSKLKLLDATYTPRRPASVRDSLWMNIRMQVEKQHPDYIAERIPSATYFDLDIASYPNRYDLNSSWKRANFKQYIEEIGVKKDDSVVVYGRGDLSGMMFAARVWYMLKAYGMKHVAVLEGGLAKWKHEEGELASGEVQKPDSVWCWVIFDHTDRIVRYDDLKFDRLGEVNMLDCRPSQQYFGSNPPPFPRRKIFVLPSPGKFLPGSKNVPLATVIDPRGELKSGEEIRIVLRAAGFTPSKPTYAMCNDGTHLYWVSLSKKLASSGAYSRADSQTHLSDSLVSEVSKRDASLIRMTGEEMKKE